MQLDQKPKTFSKFFFAFLKSTSNFEHFRKKVTLIANVFPKLRTPKNVTRTMSKKSRFRRSLEKQHGKRKLKFERQHLYHIYWSMWRQLTYKKSVLVICNKSNTSSADGRYSLLNTDNLTQPIQMRVSERQRTFSRFFLAFLKSSLNFEHFEKKMSLIADVFPKLRTPKNVVRSMFKKSRFGGSFEKKHGKRDQTLLKFQRQHLYHIHWSLWRQMSSKGIE